MATRSADVLILKDDKPLAGQSGASFEASNEFEEYVDRVAAAYGQCMTSRELTGQDFSIDMSMVANLTNASDEDVFVILWNAWKRAEDLAIKIAVKKSGYTGASSVTSQTEKLIEATMKIETFSGDFEDGLAGLEISLVVNGKAELSARPMMAISEE
ncbi:Uncharacterised protein [[Clostridium] sordellii]|uniref:hypothetical protein n=1 Tax=Paraclostridium sordellii TaxID=1505 RepID=UPI0005E236BE|nr:hypothetical protein [Paeniclostridium sordellii]CEN84167.1 Uncharacterised protein [[Clostridium] sordellii] [Paeniclostridium sordellii]CEO09647.1 Uncharacterised protein [[Clostridium] sordellii] [Paeniclostridium sordellii]